MKQEQEMSGTQEAAQITEEFPAAGTSLNPISDCWGFTAVELTLESGNRES